jgi:membrane protease YdiL (CAAX protease family)
LKCIIIAALWMTDVDTPARTAEQIEAAVDRAQPSGRNTVFRLVEFALLYFGIPTGVVVAFGEGARFPLIPFLLVVTLGCLAALLADRSFDRRQLWNARRAARHLRRILLIFAAGAALIALGTALFEPGRLFSLVRANPALWAAIMVLYPLLSVYPQELIFRTFFFHRYGALFPAPAFAVAANAAAFGYMHVVMQNALAVALSFVGGLLFAYTYHHTRSTVASSIEHALYGCFIFTIGLGWYFYGGAVR